jgi:hypothetical protein
MKVFAIALALAIAAGFGSQSALGQSKTVILITDEESTLPAAPESDLKFRAGISRGPSIVVLSPKPGESGLRSPFRLRIKFEGRGGAQIDPDSLKLSYNKKSAVDLTPRVKPYVLAAGIDLPEASVPPGEHSFRAEIKDKEGRTGSVIFIISVSK